MPTNKFKSKAELENERLIEALWKIVSIHYRQNWYLYNSGGQLDPGEIVHLVKSIWDSQLFPADLKKYLLEYRP